MAPQFELMGIWIDGFELINILHSMYAVSQV